MYELLSERTKPLAVGHSFGQVSDHTHRPLEPVSSWTWNVCLGVLVSVELGVGVPYVNVNREHIVVPVVNRLRVVMALVAAPRHKLALDGKGDRSRLLNARVRERDEPLVLDTGVRNWDEAFVLNARVRDRDEALLHRRGCGQRCEDQEPSRNRQHQDGGLRSWVLRMLLPTAFLYELSLSMDEPVSAFGKLPCCVSCS